MLSCSTLAFAAPPSFTLQGPTGAEVTRGGQITDLDAADAWPGATVDVRLGANVAAGRRNLMFTAIDAGGMKAYGFEAGVVAAERRGATAGVREELVTTGVYRFVGPTREYEDDARGRLLKFVGRTGTFTSEEAP